MFFGVPSKEKYWNVNSSHSKASLAGVLIASSVIIYLLTPMIAGLFPNVDRRGPKVFWIEHHQLFCTLSHELVYHEKPRPFLSERAWFYGLEGKVDCWSETMEAVRQFEERVDERAILVLRHWMSTNAKGSTNGDIPKSEWPESFATNGVVEVKMDRSGVYVLLNRGQRHEGGLFLLSENSDKKTSIENDTAYSRSRFWSSGVYRYYREFHQ